jgi:hypothetical protein
VVGPRHDVGDTILIHHSCGARFQEPFWHNTENQKTILLSYFNNGMVGVGRNFLVQINAASAETGLSEKQVKVCLFCYVSIHYHLIYRCSIMNIFSS